MGGAKKNKGTEKVLVGTRLCIYVNIHIYWASLGWYKTDVFVFRRVQYTVWGVDMCLKRLILRPSGEV